LSTIGESRRREASGSCGTPAEPPVKGGLGVRGFGRRLGVRGFADVGVGEFVGVGEGEFVGVGAGAFVGIGVPGFVGVGFEAGVVGLRFGVATGVTSCIGDEGSPPFMIFTLIATALQFAVNLL